MENRARRAYSALRIIVALVVVVAVFWTARSALRELDDSQRRIEQEITDLQARGATPAEIATVQLRQLLPENIGWFQLAAAAVLYGSALVASAVFWHHCLAAFGQSVSRRVALSAHVLGQVGKYVPGKAMVILIRTAAVARHSGAKKIPAAVAVFVETLTMMACGAAMAGVAVIWIPVPVWVRVLAVAMAASAAIPTLPPLFRQVLDRISRGRFGEHAALSIAHYRWPLMLRGWLWMGLAWILIGSSFWMIVLATPGAAPTVATASGFAATSATISLAMVAGFLSLIPGGAGVRELVIMAVLAPLAGAGPAMIAAIASRLLYLIVEAIASGMAWAYLGSRGREQVAGDR